MPTSIAVFFILFAAIFTQSVLGFGSALIAMSVLSELLGLQTAVPFFALVALLVEVILVIYYRHALNLRNVWRLVVGSLAAVPLGLYALRHVPETVMLPVLGGILVTYALYVLSGMKLPELHHPGWAFGMGFVSGLIGSAYNTSGPPVIIYGNCRRWSPAEFKANLQGLFMVNSVAQVFAHGIVGNYTPEVWQYTGISVLAVLTGIVLGTRLDRFINPVLFRKFVLWGLILLGAHLVIG